MAQSGTTASTAVVQYVILNSSGGNFVSLSAYYTVTDSAGNTYNTSHTFDLNATIQQHLANLMTDIGNALGNATNLNVSFA